MDDDSLDQLGADLAGTLLGGWVPSRPAPLVYVPAETVTGSLRGRRVVVGKPGWGWRHDLRADDAVSERGRRMVPVLDEAAWYRSEHDQVEVFAPLVPVEHVWLEQLGDGGPGGDDRAAGGTVLDRVVELDAPPTRHPLPARDVPGLTGRRLVLSHPDRDRRAIRAISEPYQRDDGEICVRIADEAEWYRWGTDGIPPAGVTAPIVLLWVET